MRFELSYATRGLCRSVAVTVAIACGTIFAPRIEAQRASNDLGNGGRHTIQGRIYVSNGRRSETWGLKVRVTSVGTGELFLITDETGTFVFRNLNAGSYAVVVEGGDLFEDVRESVVIDDPGSSSIRSSSVRIRSVPRIANVQVYLRPKITVTNDSPPAVLNVKWTDIPKAAVEHFKRGIELVRDGKIGDAETQFQSAVRLAPNFAPAHTELGRIAQKAGKLDVAVEAYNNAIRYDASDFDAHLNLGFVLLSQKKYREAEAMLVNAAFLNRSEPTPHYYLGMLFVMQNDVEVAQKALETAKDLKGGKTFPSIHKYLGRIYSTKRMNREAVQELETYLNLAPTAPDAVKVRQDISDIRSRQN